ncbi:hypothetical protein Hanom_Chr10g00933931 [Helianthus anomalus]
MSKSSWLLFLKSSSLYSYGIPFSAKAILTLMPNMLAQKSRRISCSCCSAIVRVGGGCRWSENERKFVEVW